jgi:hypothetical protein
MRRSFFAVSLTVALALAVAGPAVAKRRVRFTDSAVGAQISATQAVFKVRDSVFGVGAGIQTVKLNGSRGTDTTTTFYGNASATSKDSFTIGAANANGVAKITGSGRDVTGTGRARGLESTYTFTGTFNLKTLVYRVTLKGIYTF